MILKSLLAISQEHHHYSALVSTVNTIVLNFTKNIDFINKIYDNSTETSMVNNEWGINHLEVPFSWVEICAANTTDLAESDMLCNGHFMQ